MTAVPIFRALTNTTYAIRTDTVLTAPSGLTDYDILVVFIFLHGTAGAPPAVTPPAGFTELSTSPTNVVDSVANQGDFHVYWKRAFSESGSYTFSHAVTTTEGVMLAISGAINTGNPTDGSFSRSHSVAGGGALSTATNAGVVTTVNNDLLIYAVHDWDALSKVAPGGFTEIFDVTLVEIATQNLSAAGATGATTQTVNSAGSDAPWATYTIAITPTPILYSLINVG